MTYKMINAGNNIPHEINVIIEIPAHSNPIKYEIDKKTGRVFVDRFLGTAMHYPCDYGYIPQTLSEDSDPVDVLVICPFPLLPGSVVRCRPIGLLDMVDEAGPDSKLIAVPIGALTPLYNHIHQPEDLPASTLNTIKHFFDHYKDLESNRWVKTAEWRNAEKAKKEIVDSIERYKVDQKISSKERAE